MLSSSSPRQGNFYDPEFICEQLIPADSFYRQFKQDMKLRPGIEGKLSEMKRYHGLARARYRGLKKVSLQCYFTAVAVNLKRWIKLEMEKLKAPPDPATDMMNIM